MRLIPSPTLNVRLWSPVLSTRKSPSKPIKSNIYIYIFELYKKFTSLKYDKKNKNKWMRKIL